jgi:2-octaprenyl-6-methoxyphenol hydroxylase
MNEIAVIGTGLSGLVQAWALAQQNFAVTLIGPLPKASSDDRTTAILMPGIEFLQQLDLWQDSKSSATALNIMELIDQKRHLVFDAAEIGQASFGHNISNEALKNALVRQLKKASVTWHQENASAFTLQEDGWQITLTSNKKITAQLLIGADGFASPTRQAAGIAIEQKQIDQSAIVTILQAEKPHQNTSVEWYLQGGPLTLVPMPKQQLAVVWCNQTEIQNAKKSVVKRTLETELNAITNGRFGTLQIIAPLQIWPVRPMKARQLVAPHCALVGEAAHVLAPIGAQGFNISLHDIMTLTRLLSEGREAGLPVSHPTLLRRYEKIRLPEIATRYHGVNTLNTLLRSPFAPLHLLRRFSLLGIEKFPFIKQQLMHKGMTQNT